MSLPFDIYFEEFPDGTPIKFKHDPESRAELKKKRTLEELIDIIDENGLEVLVENAIFNNAYGFSHLPEPGYIKKDGEDYYVMLEGMDPMKLNVNEMPSFLEMAEMYSLEACSAIIYIVNGEMKLYVMYFDSAEEKDNFWEFGETYIPFFELFAEHTGIDTLHKFGKAINKGTEIHRDFVEKYDIDEDFCDDNFEECDSFDVPRYEI